VFDHSSRALALEDDLVVLSVIGVCLKYVYLRIIYAISSALVVFY
jgi:hypothetical protein